MSLDLTRVTAQVGKMVASLKDASGEKRKRLQCALDTLKSRAGDTAELRRKITSSKTTWLVADPQGSLDGHYAAPPTPADFTVMAVDGSHIDVDRHRATRCYLINTGSVVIHYGDNPGANLFSLPRLYAEDEDLVILPPGGKGREQLIEGNLLGIKRGIEECRQLATLAMESLPGSANLALLDGSLLLWSLAAYPDFVTEALLDKSFLSYLEDMRKLNHDRRLAIASYISFTRSADVVNALRVALCPHKPVDCDRFCSAQARDCDMVAGVQDKQLFSNLLAEGERSTLFISQSSINEKHYGAHLVHFFYIRVGDEISRVEVPQWVAIDVSLLNLTHSLVYDQCRRGHGYPVAMSEAHEQAVVTGADRENFWELVESSLEEERLPVSGSAKSFSKRTRWV